MENKNYPKWIDEYARACHRAFANMVPTSWGPVDGFAVVGALNGSFLSKLHDAIKAVKEQGHPINEIAATFSCLSSLRASLFFLIYEYQQSNPKNKEQTREIFDFLVGIIHYLAKGDAFAYESNIGHSTAEIDVILNETLWRDGNPGISRELGKLYTSLASLVFALYRDFFPQDSHEIYGPYLADKKFGEGTILLIKHFSKIKPVDLWPEFHDAKYKDVKIFQIYRNVKFKCEMIGMHSIYEGDLMKGLAAYAVLVDGKYLNNPEEIKALSQHFAELAAKQSLVYESFSKQDLVKKFLEWYCYQFVDFFRLAKMGWRPTEGMLRALQGKEIPDRLDIDELPSFEEYIKSPEFEIYWMKDLYA
jgi:hypothetical protein